MPPWTHPQPPANCVGLPEFCEYRSHERLPQYYLGDENEPMGWKIMHRVTGEEHEFRKRRQAEEAAGAAELWDMAMTPIPPDRHPFFPGSTAGREFGRPRASEGPLSRLHS